MDYHDGAMVALIPSTDDATRLAVDDYEPPQELHVTLTFLGKAEDIDDWTALEAGCRRIAAKTAPIEANPWAVSHFNPTGEDPCAVYLMGNNEALEPLRDEVNDLCYNEMPNLPQQHSPWVPHMTMGYGLDPNTLTQAGTPITLDKIRIAVGGHIIDIPLEGGEQEGLAASAGYAGWDVAYRLDRLESALLAGVGDRVSNRLGKLFDELLHPRGKDGRFIEKNGFVHGDVTPDGGGPKVPANRAKVVRFIPNPKNSGDPIVEVDLGGGKHGRALASEIETTAGAKARLSGNVPNVPDASVTDAATPDVNVPDLPELSADRITEIMRGDGEPTVVHTVDEALAALASGQKVDLQQPDQVNILLDRMTEIVNDAKLKGEQAPNYNLCEVTVEGASLFCAESKGIPRVEMPQLSGEPLPDTPAANLPRNERGHVDLADGFRKSLEDRGVTITDTELPATHLKASQNELNGAQVARLAKSMEDGSFVPDAKAIFVSKDGYVVDGHHRWAAAMSEGLGTGDEQNMNVSVVDMGILDLLAEANTYAKEQGVPQLSVGQTDTGLPLEQTPDRGFDTSPGDRGLMTSEQVSQLTAEEQSTYINNLTGSLSTTDSEARSGGLDDIFKSVGMNSKLNTDNVHNHLGDTGDQWTAEREAMHEQMYNDLKAKIDAAGIPQEHDALALGGLPGAGKSSALLPGGPAEQFGVVAWDPGERPDPPEGVTHVSINPDSIKEMLIDAGALPPNIDGLKPLEQVAFIHEESSTLSKIWLARLSDEGYNVVLDNTMDFNEKTGNAKGMLGRMAPLAEDGYAFRGLFVDITPEESLASAKRRYAISFDSERGGRFVPSSVQADRSSRHGRMSANRDAFDQLAGIDENGAVSGTGWFKDFMVIDNTGVSNGTPKKQIVLSGQGDGSPAEELRKRVYGNDSQSQLLRRTVNK